LVCTAAQAACTRAVSSHGAPFRTPGGATLAGAFVVARTSLENLQRAPGQRAAVSPISKIVLEEQETWSSKVGRHGLEVVYISGQVWITVEGDPIDYMLVAGDTFSTASRGRLVAIMAFRKAQLGLGPIHLPDRRAPVCVA